MVVLQCSLHLSLLEVLVRQLSGPTLDFLISRFALRSKRTVSDKLPGDADIAVVGGTYFEKQYSGAPC